VLDHTAGDRLVIAAAGYRAMEDFIADGPAGGAVVVSAEERGLEDMVLNVPDAAALLLHCDVRSFALFPPTTTSVPPVLAWVSVRGKLSS